MENYKKYLLGHVQPVGEHFRARVLPKPRGRDSRNPHFLWDFVFPFGDDDFDMGRVWGGLGW